MLQTLLAFGAGIATVASPCVLPVLPILLGTTALPAGGSGSAARHRPLFIVIGFVLSFAAAALLFGASTRVLGVSADALRTAAVVVLLGLGVLLLWPALWERAAARFGGLAGVAQRVSQHAGSGPAGGLLIGMSLGLVWTPCAGPVLASILALVAAEEQPLQAALLLGAYDLGAGLPMLAIGYGGQAMAARVRLLARHASGLRRGFGLAVVATALAMHWQVDAMAAAWVSRVGTDMTAGDTAPVAATEAERAPEFVGLDRWFNAEPTTLAQLRGKVVLVDFWTFACVNCLNTMPHVKSWHAKFRDQGLVVVGIHTPEFAFERESSNVQAAIKRLGIEFAVAQDNRYRTWTNWRNQYWPAFYLVDHEGRIVYRHVGEGRYDEMEQQIRKALAAAQRPS